MDVFYTSIISQQPKVVVLCESTYPALYILAAVIRTHATTIRTNEFAAAAFVCALNEGWTFFSNWKKMADSSDVVDGGFSDMCGVEEIL
jgi:hypothetical protein